MRKLIFALLLLPQPAFAAAFCVQMQGITPQCIYDDARECRKRALELDAICNANPATTFTTTGLSPYCVADSNRNAQCYYYDRGSCDREADRQNATCINSPLNPPEIDVYKFDPNRRY